MLIKHVQQTSIFVECNGCHIHCEVSIILKAKPVKKATAY